MLKKQCYKGLFDVYMMSQRVANSDSAQYYINQHLAIQDTLLNEEMIKEVAQAREKFEADRKEQENRILTAENDLQKTRIESEEQQRIIQWWTFGGVLLLLGALLAVFLIRKRAADRLKEAAWESQRFRAVLRAEEEERSRISRELHDGLGQLLSTARLHIGALKKAVPDEKQTSIHQATGLIDESVQEVRNISHNLMPATLQGKGLSRAVRNMAHRISDSGTIEVTVHDQLESVERSEWDELMLYRVIQEIVNNSIRHSGCTKMDITMKAAGSGQLIVVKDNGKGIDPAQMEDSTGMGWSSIRNRVALLGGTLQVERGEGSTFVITIPVRP